MSDRSDPADILLVEDNRGGVRLTEEAFKEGQTDNTLHVVTDGIEALDFLYQRGDHTDSPYPDLILLGLNLPRKNGDRVLAETRNDPDLSKNSVIVLMSSGDQGDVVKSDELQASILRFPPSEGV